VYFFRHLQLYLERVFRNFPYYLTARGRIKEEKNGLFHYEYRDGVR